MKKKLFILFGLAFIILLADQWLKLEVKANWDEMLSDRGLSSWENIDIIGDWFVLDYTENKGMAFGTTLGNGDQAKLILSSLRVAAVILIAFLIIRMSKKNLPYFILIAMALVWAGAFGNLLDSLFHDFIFPTVNPEFDTYEDGTLRSRGMMFGNVVDMLQFDVVARYPGFIPGIGGQNIFGFIFNIADAAISIGVVMLIVDSLFFEKKRRKLQEEAQ